MVATGYFCFSFCSKKGSPAARNIQKDMYFSEIRFKLPFFAIASVKL